MCPDCQQKNLCLDCMNADLQMAAEEQAPQVVVLKNVSSGEDAFVGDVYALEA